MSLKPTVNFAQVDNLIVSAVKNFGLALESLQAAQQVHQDLSQREAYKQSASDFITCLQEHFEAALDLIPSEETDPKVQP